MDMEMLLAWMTAPLLAVANDERQWVDEIVYGIIIEKFFDGDPTNNYMKEQFAKERDRYEGGFWGGDLKGVIDRLEDLADLGITTILLYPVMQNDERPIGKFLPTGYRPKDYESVDRNFGETEVLRSLVEAAHVRGIRVILDLPITLPGFEHPFLAEPAKKDWFGPTSEYGVPRWKVENPEVADYIIGVSKRWKARSGCDGFRIDSAHLQPITFWKRFVAELKSAPPEGSFLILPELTVNPREIGRIVREAGFDGAYDFSTLRLRDVLGRDEDVTKLSFIAKEAKQFYGSPRSMMAPIDNYELAFASISKEPKAARTKLALTYILTLDRVPLLYAGNELGMAFREVGGAFPPDRHESSFLKEVKALIELRKREPALRRGDFTILIARDSVFGFLRCLGEDRILVVLNGSGRTREFAMPIGDRPWRDCLLEDLIGGQVIKSSGIELAMQVEAFGARIVRVK
jgi:cyclomaltodextrinase / maltogenic alpha-amylase / neopullulanase